MSWDPEMLPQLSQLYYSGEFDRFIGLIRENPQYLRRQDGSDIWLQKAASDGHLQVIQALVELGLDINTPDNPGDPTNSDDQFSYPEGAIMWAATEGQQEVVRWMLDHGARINYVVNGKSRCIPLISAARKGHLDIVKLLVQQGADIYGNINGLTAINEAEDFGQYDVRDYLHSLGARTLRDTTPPDYPSAHKRFIKQMTDRRGPLGGWKREIPGESLVTIHQIPASDKWKEQTLFTVGLSDHRLPHGRYQHFCTELHIMLSPDWPLTDEALRDPRFNWPVEWMKRIAEQLRTAERMPDEPVIFLNGDPPTPLAPNTGQCGWLALKSEVDGVQAPDYRWIAVHSLIPLYPEEFELLEQIGQSMLIERFHERNIPVYIDPQRPNVAE